MDKTNKQLDVINFRRIKQTEEGDAHRVMFDAILRLDKTKDVRLPEKLTLEEALLSVNISKGSITIGIMEDTETGARLTSILHKNFKNYAELTKDADFEDGADRIADYIFEAILKIYFNKHIELEECRVTSCAELIGFCHDLSEYIEKFNKEESDYANSNDDGE